MPKLVEQLDKNKMTLIVELPQNTVELAEAAIAGGADAVQFGGLIEDEEKMATVIEKTQLPVGIGYFRNIEIKPKHMKKIADMGFDFINLGLEHFSAAVVQLKDITKVLALNSRYNLDDVVGISKMGINALDAAIIPAAERGRGLVIGDLQNYISIVLAAGVPVIVPTQRAIRPSEVAIMADAGVKGLLLTAAVTGTTAGHIREAVQKYRAAADDLA